MQDGNFTINIITVNSNNFVCCTVYVNFSPKSTLLVTWVHVPTISVSDFQRPIGIVALSLNHMLRNLGRALLSVFSS
jgi:hypothetical protein